MGERLSDHLRHPGLDILELLKPISTGPELVPLFSRRSTSQAMEGHARPDTTWARRGLTPLLRRVSKRREVSSVVAVTPIAPRHPSLES